MLRLKLLGGVAALSILSGTAMAADMPAPYTPPVAAEPAPLAYDWTGVYVGVHAGYGWGDREVDLGFGDDANFGYDSEGFLGGAQLGANWQVNQIVFGVEGDFSWSGIDGDTDPFDTDGEFSVGHDLDWLATVRGRVGAAFDRFLVYGTAGVAFTEVDAYARFDDEFTARSNANHIGWTIGAGIEAALTDSLSLKAEYLYADFGSETYALRMGDTPISLSYDGDLDMHIVRAGLNYRFNMFGKGVPY